MGAYDKVVHWFDVIKEELCRLDLELENCYNMDETDIMLSMLSTVKVLIGKMMDATIEELAQSGRW